MAGPWANAALKDQTWPHDLRYNGSAVPTDVFERITTGGLARSISQASTLQIAMQNGDRYVTAHEAANPFLNPTPRWIYGIPNGFTLVQIAKSGDAVTLTCEDWVINHLRGFTGTRAQAPGTRTFVDFSRQLCAEAGVPIIADNAAAPLQQPVSRGGTNAPNEDTWTCLTRMAGDRGWYCFSDGTSIILGPASWLLSWGGAPAMTISEAANPRSGTVVDLIDGSMDTGKPVASLSVTTRASEWRADPGAWVRVASGLGPLSGDWIVSDINRQNLASDQLAVSLAVPTPPKAEPAAESTGSASTASSSAPQKMVTAEDGSKVPASYYGSGNTAASSSSGSTTPPPEAASQRVVYGTVSTTVWNNLLQQGYTPQGGGGGTVLMVKPSDYRLANL